MRRRKRYQRKVFTVEILANGDLSTFDPKGILSDVYDDCSVEVREAKTERLTPMKMAEALDTHETDRAFFMGEECRKDQPHTAIEFDLKYFGGDYSDTGDFVFIPNDFIDNQPTVEQAFIVWTGHDACHIVTIYLDEEYKSDGQPWDELSDVRLKFQESP